MREGDRTTLIGWQGISARVPADWTLAAVGGERRAGYLRVDCARMPRLQVKWSRRHIDLERKRSEYIKRLSIGKRGRPTGIEATADIKIIGRRAKPKKDLVDFGWRGPQCGVGLLWNCQVCGRALIAQVSWPIEEEGRETAQRVLESIEDHGVEGWETWGVEGLAFLAPSSFELEGWRRLTRYLDLRLAKGEEKLKVARWGMVPLVLQGHSLRDWYAKENRRRRDVNWEAQDLEIKGHEGIAAWGERRRIAGRIRTRAARAVGRMAAVEFAAVMWHCPESNRLYLVEALHRGDAEAFHGAVESILCHEEQ